jgi:transcriptional regulator with GAF, ATPase, and Fis domain
MTEPVLVGSSQAIGQIRQDIELASRCHAKVLITGETGVGKEVVAQLIHEGSPRRLQRLVTINCAGLPDSLLESELFGHVRGSFTDAYRDKPGLFESANRGTLFLDEVGEMSPRLQALVLRFLETGEVQRVGGNGVHACVDVRVIAATNRDLHERIVAGAFRDDLFYRLNVIGIHVPPLRERREDVPALLDHFLDKCSLQHGVARRALSPEAARRLLECEWSGNVRQLRNVVERVVLRATRSTIDLSDLPRDLDGATAAKVSAGVEKESQDGRSARPVAADLVAEMIDGGESFWSTVHPHFMKRDLGRDVLRDVIARGLAQTKGNYRMLVRLFNMPSGDYKRFLGFLSTHGCLVEFRTYRTVCGQPPRAVAPKAAGFAGDGTSCCP